MIQRVRVGLTGLAVVFLLVLLAAAIFGEPQEPEPSASGNMALADNAADVPQEPLAELGVAPGGETVNAAATSPAPAPATPSASRR